MTECKSQTTVAAGGYPVSRCPGCGSYVPTETIRSVWPTAAWLGSRLVLYTAVAVASGIGFMIGIMIHV